jgi:pimeloyl-ACP methyl ester carboxylesterase
MILHSNILGAGKPFVILHGFLGMGDNWKTLGNQFSDLGYQVHLVDQRNHGRSFHSQEFNYELLASDLKSYLEFHSIEKIILLGHSMGGKTAMTFATRYPEMVSHLMVADIAPRYYPVHHETILEGLSRLDFETINSRTEADEALSNYITNKGIRQFLLKNLYWVDKNQLGLRINLPILKKEVSEVGEALEAFAKFDGPVLFLKGDRSEYIQEADAALILRHFSKAEIVSIEKSGHWLHAENPKAFYTAVTSFIANN